MILVTSWDDGHPLDEHIAELLTRYCVRGTFYVPVRNREGRPVMNADALRRLVLGGFEIGGHTLDHSYLTTIPPASMYEQLVEGKDRLEQTLGQRIDGFCYPGGEVNAAVREAVRRAGFKHGRTTENLRLDRGADPYCVPTTLQFYPHTKRVLWGNFLRHGHYRARGQVLRLALAAVDWRDRVPRIAKALASTGVVLHLWGHSWEIEELDLWRALESTLEQVATVTSQRLCVGELFARS